MVGENDDVHQKLLKQTEHGNSRDGDKNKSGHVLTE